MTCLAVVRSQHDPSTETVPEVNHGGTAGETDDVRKCRSQSDDENLTRGHQIHAVTHHSQQRAQSLTPTELHLLLLKERVQVHHNIDK